MPWIVSGHALRASAALPPKSASLFRLPVRPGKIAFFFPPAATASIAGFPRKSKILSDDVYSCLHIM
jgi:hypothetical protein